MEHLNKLTVLKENIKWPKQKMKRSKGAQNTKGFLSRLKFLITKFDQQLLSFFFTFSLFQVFRAQKDT